MRASYRIEKGENTAHEQEGAEEQDAGECQRDCHAETDGAQQDEQDADGQQPAPVLPRHFHAGLYRVVQFFVVGRVHCCFPVMLSGDSGSNRGTHPEFKTCPAIAASHGERSEGW